MSTGWPKIRKKREGDGSQAVDGSQKVISQDLKDTHPNTEALAEALRDRRWPWLRDKYRVGKLSVLWLSLLQILWLPGGRLGSDHHGSGWLLCGVEPWRVEIV